MSKELYYSLLRKSENKLTKFCTNFSKSIINNRASIFIGSGMSMNSNVPSWSSLLEECWNELQLSEHYDVDLTKLAQYYTNNLSDAQLRLMLNDKLNQAFQSNPILSNLLELNFTSIWTTNYDKLIEKELDLQNKKYKKFISEKELPYSDTYNKINLYKINGDIDVLHKMVITLSDFENYYKEHSFFLTFLKRELIAKQFLFIGYSFNDNIVLNCIHQVAKLLDGSVIHYNIQVIDEDITLDKVYYYEDLEKRYNICTIYVSKETIKNPLKKSVKMTIKEYTTLNTAITRLKQHVYAKKVFISGAFYDIDEDEMKFADGLSKAITKMLLDNDYCIVTGVGKNLGTYITCYAHQYLAEKNNINPYIKLTMRPYPFHKELTEVEKYSYRSHMQCDCGSAIFMFGQSKSTDEINKTKESKHYSYGVYQEFEVAKKRHSTIIPIGSTGYEASVITEEVQDNIFSFGYLEKYIKTLNESKDITEITNIIKFILKKQNNYM